MALIKKKWTQSSYDKKLHSSKVKSVVVVPCTCGNEKWTNFKKRELAYIIEELFFSYMGGSRGTSRTRTDSKFATTVCLAKGCLGRRRVRYNPKERGWRGLLWSEYVTMKEKEGAGTPITGVMASTIQRKQAQETT